MIKYVRFDTKYKQIDMVGNREVYFSSVSTSIEQCEDILIAKGNSANEDMPCQTMKADYSTGGKSV